MTDIAAALERVTAEAERAKANGFHRDTTEWPYEAEPAPFGEEQASGSGEERPDDDVVRHFKRIPIDLDVPPRPPAMVSEWVYAGRLTMLQSEPGVGKSWLATWLALKAMEAGLNAIYVDEEGGEELVTERLAALGADAAMVRSRFWYYAFESRRWDDDDLAAFDAMLARVARPCGLCVLDSLPDFLTAAGMNEDSSGDVTSFIAKVCGRLRGAGIAQVMLDHLTKPPTEGKSRRGRYSRGSGAKLAKADATLLLEVHTEFDATTSGRVHLWKTKDRRGRLLVPSLGKAPIPIEVMVGGGGVSIQPGEPSDRAAAGSTWQGPTNCMDAVLDLLGGLKADDAISRNETARRLRGLGKSYGNETISEALERLVASGDVLRSTAGRGTVFRVAPDEVEEMF